MVCRRQTLLTGVDRTGQDRTVRGTDSACCIVLPSVRDSSDHFQGQLFVCACYAWTIRDGFDESWQTCHESLSADIRNLTLWIWPSCLVPCTRTGNILHEFVRKISFNETVLRPFLIWILKDSPLLFSRPTHFSSVTTAVPKFKINQDMSQVLECFWPESAVAVLQHIQIFNKIFLLFLVILLTLLR